MEIIKRNHKTVIANGGRNISRQYVSVDKNKIYFTAGVTRLLGLSEGLYVVFMNEGDKWNFFVDDDADGFKLTPCREKGGFHVSNTGLTKMILSSMGFKNSKRFSVVKTNNYTDKCQIYELSTEGVSNVIR